MREFARAARAARAAQGQGRARRRDRRREPSRRETRAGRFHDPRRDEVRAARETLSLHQLRHGPARARGRARQAEGPRRGGRARAQRGWTMRTQRSWLLVVALLTFAGGIDRAAGAAGPKNIIILFADGVAAT